MNIAKFEEAVINCRFCFMCRHLSGVSNVTAQEADTPRVRAASYYSVLKGFAPIDDPELIQHTYDADLSRACCHHCCQYKRDNHKDSSFDENGMILAFRQDVVDAGLAPEKVRRIADAMEATAKWTVSGKGDVLYFIDNATAKVPGIVKAFEKLAAKGSVKYQTAKGGCIGKALSVLGFEKRAKAVAKKFAAFLNKTGAKTVVVSNPAAYDALKNDYPAWGLKLGARVMHSSEFIAGLKLTFSKKAAPLFYLESDFLKNYNDAYPFPGRLLAMMKAKIKDFGTNNEESYTCGEGAVLLEELNPALVGMLADYVATREAGTGRTPVVVSSPYTCRVLSEKTKLNVMSLEEFAAKSL